VGHPVGRAPPPRGCAGIDLLAYRATDADPLALVRAARRGIGDGRLIVAGRVDSAQQIHALAAAGADAFTVGSAVFDGTFSPTKGSLRSQVHDILDACASAPAMAS
jgi:heptaprenylglyceryl phosphate synthase